MQYPAYPQYQQQHWQVRTVMINYNKWKFPHSFYVITITKKGNKHTRLTALFLGLPGLAGTRKVKLISILLKQETASGSGISWAIHKSAPSSRQITMPCQHPIRQFFTRWMPFLSPNQSIKALKAVTKMGKHNWNYKFFKLITIKHYFNEQTSHVSTPHTTTIYFLKNVLEMFPNLGNMYLQKSAWMY